MHASGFSFTFPFSDDRQHIIFADVTSAPVAATAVLIQQPDIFERTVEHE